MKKKGGWRNRPDQSRASNCAQGGNKLDARGAAKPPHPAEPATAPEVGTSWMQSETQEAGDLDKDSKLGAGARLVQQPLREPLPQVRQVGVLFEASDERVEVPPEVGLLAVGGL